MASSGLSPKGTAQILLDWDPLAELDEATPRPCLVDGTLQRDTKHRASGRRVASIVVVCYIDAAIDS